MNTHTPTTSPRSEAHAAFGAARSEAGEYLLGRGREYDVAVLGLLTGNNVFLLSKPGTAKSALADVLFRQIGAADHEAFRLLCSAFTAPDELWGPVSLPALEREEFVRVSGGRTLRRAQVAFLDEVGKLGEAQQNALLTALNERCYDNGTRGRERLPLRFVVGASNEDIESPALKDRFVLRAWVDYLGPDSTHAADLVRRRFRNPEGIRPSLSWETIERARCEVAALADTAPDHVVDAVLRIASSLKRDAGIEVSDRKLTQILPVLAAQAWLDGATQVSTRHLWALEYLLWSDVDQIGQIKAAIRLHGGADSAVEDTLRGLRALAVEAGKGDAARIAASLTDLRDALAKQAEAASPEVVAEAEGIADGIARVLSTRQVTRPAWAR